MTLIEIVKTEDGAYLRITGEDEEVLAVGEVQPDEAEVAADLLQLGEAFVGPGRLAYSDGVLTLDSASDHAVQTPVSIVEE